MGCLFPILKKKNCCFDLENKGSDLMKDKETHWDNEKNLLAAFEFYTTPLSQNLKNFDYLFLAQLPPGEPRSLKKIIANLDNLFSALGVRRLVSKGFIKIKKEDKDLTVVKIKLLCQLGLTP